MKRVFRLPGARHIDNAVDDELRFHLEGRVEELMEREHLSREDAEREARRRFGDYAAYAQAAREIDERTLRGRDRMELFDTLRRETRHALRTLRSAPAFSAIAIITLALGLGAATTIFTLLDRVVLRPLPYPHADRLVDMGTRWAKLGAGDRYALSKGQYFYFRKHSTTLADLMMYDTDIAIVPADSNAAAERVPMLLVSANSFRILGIRPLIGRTFDTELETSRDPRVALISHGLWQRRFGGDAHIIGQRLSLGPDGTVEIIGVLPPNASVPETKADVWIRDYLNPSDPPQNNHTHHAIGVMKPGVTVAAVATDIQRIQDRMQAEYPNVYGGGFVQRVGFSMDVMALRDAVVGKPVVRALWLLFGAVAFVLLIAAANVANLFLVRIDARQREAAVRMALGANRTQLGLHYLAESGVLALVAGIAAVGIAFGLLHIVLAIAPQSLPRLEEVALDARALAFCFGCAVAFGVIFGLLPLSSSIVNVAALRDGGRGLTSSRSREVARRSLVLTQVALAVVLLSGALLMTKSFARLRGVRPGFDPTGVLTMSFLLPSSHYRDAATAAAFWHELTQRVAALPGVTQVGGTDEIPLSDGFGGCTSVVTDTHLENVEKSNCMPFITVMPGYFEALGIKVRGTTPTWSSVEARSAPVVVTPAFAHRFWGDDDPIGHHVKPFNQGMPDFTVVGVAEDIHGRGVQEPVVQAIYFPLLPPPGMTPGLFNVRFMNLLVRAPRADLTALANSVRTVARQLDPQVPLADVQPMEAIVARSMARTSFTMLLLLIASVIAIVLSAVGIYGVISYVVGQRRPEIGIRLALGARLGDVARLVVGHSLAIAAAGAVIGTIASIASTRLLGSLLFDVSPTDPIILGATVLVLLVVAAAASVVPTRRAARIDPVEAMRA
jgi:predicted permease